MGREEGYVPLDKSKKSAVIVFEYCIKSGWKKAA